MNPPTSADPRAKVLGHECHRADGPPRSFLEPGDRWVKCRCLASFERATSCVFQISAFHAEPRGSRRTTHAAAVRDGVAKLLSDNYRRLRSPPRLRVKKKNNLLVRRCGRRKTLPALQPAIPTPPATPASVAHLPHDEPEPSMRSSRWQGTARQSTHTSPGPSA